jgi:uncharacterized membrane protein
MSKRYIVSLVPIIEDFQQVLSEQIGVTAFYMNLDWLANRVVELIILGKTFGDPECIEKFLAEQKISTELRKEIGIRFYNDINKAIMKAVHDYTPNHSYDYVITELFDLVITDLGNSNMGTNTPPEDIFMKDLEKSIANGDYIPERYRRMMT